METSAAAARALTARTVHIKLYPTPRSFAERREVLRVLERFGEVSMFRSLKYNRRHQNPVHNAFITLFASEFSAKELINASPLRYHLVLEPSTPQLPPSSSSKDPDPQSASEEQQEPHITAFSLNASPTTFDHNAYLTSGSQNPLHGPFRPLPPRLSYVGSSLERIIPNSLWSKGLIDWETDKGEDVADGRADGVRVSTAGKATGQRNLAGLVAWERGKLKDQKRPDVMFGLRELVEQREMVKRQKKQEAAVGMGEETRVSNEAGSRDLTW
ncbi:hypothetical protein EG329_007341 [Mollisiaceae sp. DMI_Dod_QoI]|nr:hypothetical protein EG329_007341 [Helotiales sp. DMI_Dod_QoI]